MTSGMFVCLRTISCLRSL